MTQFRLAFVCLVIAFIGLVAVAPLRAQTPVNATTPAVDTINPVIESRFRAHPSSGKAPFFDNTSVQSVQDGSINLLIDDGASETSIGWADAGWQFLWLNRFTPNAMSYPFTLTEIQVFTDSDSNCQPTDLIDLYVWTDNDNNPANGATLVSTLARQPVGPLDQFNAYSVYVPLTEPGDVLIGVVNRTCLSVPGAFTHPAALDSDGLSEQRSWVAVYDNGAVPVVPALPAPLFTIIDEQGYPGNWLIRGVGEAGINATPTATSTPNGPTPTPIPTPGGGGVQYCVNPGIAITDGDTDGVTSSLTITATDIITDLNVSLNVTHEWVGDLIFTLTHNGTTAELYDRPGVPGSTYGCEGNNLDVVVNEESTTAFEFSCSNATPAYPVGGDFIPGDPSGPRLAVFDGDTIEGTWTLTAVDVSAPDQGVLQQWCLMTGGVGESAPNTTPLIVVLPVVIETHHPSPSITTQSLPIANTGVLSLTWSITETMSLTEVQAVGTGTCSTPADIPWLSLSPSSGTSLPGGTTISTITFDSNGLSEGIYTGTLCIGSNDPTTPLVTIPVTLDAGVPTAIDLGSLTQAANGLRGADFAAVGVLLLSGAALLFRRRK